VKFLLWQRGGWKVTVGGPKSIGAHIQAAYAPDGARAFDYHFMGEYVYQQPFTVVICDPADVPPARESAKALGRHLDGCRIGFDLGASDLKVSAVVDGQAIFSEEMSETDRASRSALPLRAHRVALPSPAQAPEADAIGGSSAGVIVENRPMVASLFRGIPADRYPRSTTSSSGSATSSACRSRWSTTAT
jgi:hypothetical protein